MKLSWFGKGGAGDGLVVWLAAAVVGCASNTTRQVGEHSASTESGGSLATPVDTSDDSASTAPLFGGGVASSSAAATSESSPSSTANAPPIGACDKAVAEGAEPTIDDFEDGDQRASKQDGRDGSWYFYDDGTSGTSSVNFVADALGQRTGTVLSVAGSGFSDWGSGFGVGFNWNEGQCTYDASVYSGVQFWVRGKGQARLTLQNLSVRPISLGGQCAEDASCFDSHGVTFGIPEEWTLMRFAFNEFEQAGWGTPVGSLQTQAIYLLELQFGVIEPFAITLDDMSFFSDTDDLDAGAREVLDGSAALAPDASVGATQLHESSATPTDSAAAPSTSADASVSFSGAAP
jgi:hypothetical protein